MHPGFKAFAHSIKRIILALFVVLGTLSLAYLVWRPGTVIQNGNHDRQTNGIWLAHGWLGGDAWFTENNKSHELTKYRAPENIAALASKLRAHGITDVFPHLCPCTYEGELPPVNAEQVERFLDQFKEMRVIPWIGGPYGTGARPQDFQWRTKFVASARKLMDQHPRLAGVQINIEPLESGDPNFLTLLEELRSAFAPGKMISIAAYPPPTRWHPHPEVHWDESYFRKVSSRCDQLAVMMYDAGQDYQKPYQRLMSDWTCEVLSWSEGKPVLLGVPTYDDAGVGYHNPKVENVQNALKGIHSGLQKMNLPANYQGIAIYSDWETSGEEWKYLENHFLKPSR